MLEGSTGSTLRIQHYLPIPGAGPSTGLRALTHTDLNLITLLPAPREPGLQVQDSSGEWHDVPVSSGALVVNGGEMLELATGGRYPATPHRVVNPRSGDSLGSRLSMPMFLHPAPEVVLTPGVTASDFLARRVAELRALGWTPAPGGTDRQDDRSADVDRTIRDAVLAVSGTGPDHATAEVDEVLGQLDSLAMVELIARLESDLDLPIPAAAIQPENFASVDSIRALCGDLTRLQGQR
jgi:acyl carrier protein